jgi:hypothetical protein
MLEEKNPPSVGINLKNTQIISYIIEKLNARLLSLGVLFNGTFCATKDM